jgi:hypothetical protein
MLTTKMVVISFPVPVLVVESEEIDLRRRKAGVMMTAALGDVLLVAVAPKERGTLRIR